MLQDVPNWLIALFSAATFVWTVWYTRRKADSEVVSKIYARIDEHDRRVIRIETELTHMPDKNSQHRIELALEKLTGQVDVVSARLAPVASISERLQEFLIEREDRR